VKKSKIDYFRH